MGEGRNRVGPPVKNVTGIHGRAVISRIRSRIRTGASPPYDGRDEDRSPNLKPTRKNRGKDLMSEAEARQRIRGANKTGQKKTRNRKDKIGPPVSLKERKPQPRKTRTSGVIHKQSSKKRK